MKPHQMESILYFILDGKPLSLEDAAVLYQIELTDRLDQRQAAIRLLSLIITPPEPPDMDKLGRELIERIWNAPQHKLMYMFVDPVYPANLINWLMREKYISRALSGYFLMSKGIEVLRKLQKEQSEDDDRTATQGREGVSTPEDLGGDQSQHQDDAEGRDAQP